ncbi:FecR family protein [Mucilaginibacter sp. X4EP1]|uniref:FecR family protein n=1 Tax=Mucilaginibacter sp. X4EP1 TaxID=2723092 RepID=UPI00216A3C62|nr:FecR family protein [Mucilaginibacter sp. X4EP1]MCS3811543.1 hypothetical protein [Mucilaginibacter sp. X4EP1]
MNKIDNVRKKEFIALLDKYLKGETSDKEEALLFSVFQSFQDEQEWDANEFEGIDLSDHKPLERIKSIVNESKRRSLKNDKHLFNWKYFAAASVLLAFGLGLKYYLIPQFRQDFTPNKALTTKDFKAGGNIAYLILANGKMVPLNSSKKGFIAQQGENTILKTKEGLITYSPADKHGDEATPGALNKIIVPAGGQYQVALPDGTNVWLNSLSTLEYPVLFSANDRRVRLSGEAYFEVMKNKNKPFIVDVNGRMNVRVLGTHFNIMAYQDEDKISTTLLEGAVKIEDNVNPAGNKNLFPGQQADLLKESGRIKISAADVEEIVAWKNGDFLFNDEDTYSIMRQLSRWYNIDIAYADGVKDQYFDASLSKYKNISEVLHLMESTKGIHFKIEGRRVIVMP